MRTSILLTTALAASLAAASAFAQDFSKVEIKVEKVAGNVYMLTGAGGNIGVCAGEDGIVIIDDQFTPLAPKIRAALKSISDKPIRFIINTHYHGDHTGGNEFFGAEGTIIAQENVRKRLASGSSVRGNVTPPAAKGALPIITFNDHATVHLNGEDIRAVYFPAGHTDGDSVIEFPAAKVVHMGDDFFNGTFPFVDVQNGGSVRGMIRNVETMVSRIDDATKVIPGHGPLGDRKSLAAFGAALKGTVDVVTAGVKAGKTLDQLKAEKVLAPWDSWGQGFIKTEDWLATVYNEVKP
jgi:glyoxylase-like metal-dependent hydrolase (beta-lactamase superfamily II)